MKAELKRVLLVDDDEAIRMIARMALELGGLEVVECASGAEALRRAPRARADLILLDVMMPQMSGLHTLEALRRLTETAATPVVFLTARVMPKDVAEYRALGAEEVIVKPFDAAELPAHLRAIWVRSAPREA